MTVYGVHMDISDEMLANALFPDEVIEMSFKSCEDKVIRALQNDNLVLTEVDMVGEAFIRLRRRQWRQAFDPFDYEDDDGVVKHVDGWECTRIEVTGTIGEKS